MSDKTQELMFVSVGADERLEDAAGQMATMLRIDHERLQLDDARSLRGEVRVDERGIIRSYVVYSIPLRMS